VTATSLPFRVAYALLAFPLAAGAGFYGCILLWPRAAALLHGPDPGLDWYGMFIGSLTVGLGLGFAAALVALTMPWRRQRRRSGRGTRAVISCAVVLAATLAFTGGEHTLLFDLGFAAWLAYALTFTFVRYGVLDGVSERARRRRARAEGA